MNQQMDSAQHTYPESELERVTQYGHRGAQIRTEIRICGFLRATESVHKRTCAISKKKLYIWVVDEYIDIDSMQYTSGRWYHM